MAPVTDGDTLLLHFTSTRPDGEVFEDTRSGEPVRATLGENQINPLFEEALIGKEPGETATVALPPEKAYGKYRKRLVVTIKRTKLKLDHEPVVGEFIRVKVLGKSCLVTVLDVDDKRITIDGNHPLAGETITYTITVEEILPRDG
ncbi:peptidylprolyl isomerase [Methanoculleus sp. YWC-01]|jgi:FKBP-type peptidyl-prolyl cis-trans isomerase 2|uniref:Peptidyl-prolyl cis-trans isomerase n=1 Tax=Methanoculleus nereidis TaxID=2735141 RepID=A0ABU3Z523_9EURY|nr:FKBP-type peptidyl-prolyl cis-trans isomerase [Methanoculleus sp. YWC-01]MCK9298521.1 FKBP-type peptidyl-prolyl cis-trans isomerase [Methanoculleus sp.]MDV4343926.1 peptidylprolyl isomerase [Methanoculleus sp. YWC-01]PKL55426.1 MAG: peptidylprolyl isomerase [Methanomicrobiales archaeon HGW-Methanomicrobiales-6]